MKRKIVNIDIVSDLPVEIRGSNYEIYQAMENLPNGDWLSIEFAEAAHVKPTRLALYEYYKRRGQKLRSKSDGRFLYVKLECRK